MNLIIPRTAVVDDIKRETSDVNTYIFRMNDEQPFVFKPGQFNMLGFNGIGEAPISFSSNMLANKSFAHTIRFVGNVTGMIKNLEPRDEVWVRGPFGNGWPMGLIDDADVLVVAGGIGMAPLRPIVNELLNGIESRKKFYILYGARTCDDLLFKDELRIWRNNDKIRTLVSVDEGPVNHKIIDEVGVVTTLFKRIDIDFEKTISFVCGPEIMMRFVAKDLILKGMPASSIYVSLERRMYCGIAQCGHCQIGAKFVCRDGPVFGYSDIKRFSDTLL